MDLANFWFILLGVLWTGYLVLEGFDFGVGMLLPVLGGKRYAEGPADAEKRRRLLINTIGPVWDGNEVWVLTAGGATFAAFPHWYATLFSGFYLPLLLILVALIVRNLGFEYRHKRPGAAWKARWDQAIFWGSLVPALLWGVALTNIVRGHLRRALPHARCDLHRPQDGREGALRGASHRPACRHRGGRPRGPAAGLDRPGRRQDGLVGHHRGRSRRPARCRRGQPRRT
jgi:cytochrome d oxidase subunit CydB